MEWRSLKELLSDFFIIARMTATPGQSMYAKTLDFRGVFEGRKSRISFRMWDRQERQYKAYPQAYPRAWRTACKRAYDLRNSLPQVDTR